ncbi:MAG: xylulokinase [Actinobacteria bacterium]|nr:xylulokinase [Actinomycetota bacterium]
MVRRKLVVGVDSSTQSVKVVVRDAQTGELIRQAREVHPDGTEIDPEIWLRALNKALLEAAALEHVDAISVAGQQHGMIALDSTGKVIRDALLWNDIRSAQSASDLNSELGGKVATSRKTGSVLVASFTAAKVRWMSDHEPENASRVASIALPHDWLSWQLQGASDFTTLFTDRSDASGTGYFDPTTSHYLDEVFSLALRRDGKFALPRIAGPHEFAGVTKHGIPMAAGAGDNAAAALGVQAKVGDVVVSLGTSGTAFAVSNTPTQDPSGEVAGFADATGRFLPLVCTLNAARILDAAMRILGASHDEVGELALTSKPGANGLSLLPYFEGERTPNRPDARGVFSGMNSSNSNRPDIARAMIEGMLCGLVDAVDSLVNLGVDVNRIILIGGGARNPAVPSIASSLFGREIVVPPQGEYVADGAARQAAWALLGGAEPPQWNVGVGVRVNSSATPEVVEQFRVLRDDTAKW